MGPLLIVLSRAEFVSMGARHANRRGQMHTIRHHLQTWWGAMGDPAQAAKLVFSGAAHGGFALFLFSLILLLYAIYGFSMGLFGGAFPAMASMIKLPLLYLSTVAVAAPSLYVLNTTLGQRMTLQQCLRLLLLCVSINALALASYAPVSYFFVMTAYESTYRFLVVMHVLVFAVSGVASLGVMLVVAQAMARERGSSHSLGLLLGWGILYGLIGSQMSWALRPWIGSPAEPFAFLRPIESSFLESAWTLIRASFHP